MKVKTHKEICEQMHTVYKAKNADYGDSFSKLREKFPNAILIRLYDKLNRLETLMNGNSQQVNDESIDDTLLDLANYAIMELVERKMETPKIDLLNKPAGSIAIGTVSKNATVEKELSAIECLKTLHEWCGNIVGCTECPLRVQTANEDCWCWVLDHFAPEETVEIMTEWLKGKVNEK